MITGGKQGFLAVGKDNYTSNEERGGFLWPPRA